ncbi:4-hydroxy-3-methylbut-2-enyl diphosphate reductase [Microbispora sp. RL4-1S]|uniref:4-hydroxy-3-methylbut-2-enyl diphosphate reductase n=1 Tax=Microbispora oryzae TaxID=2806554 RepID=A0A941AJL4_9ACTN|nr:4-hydroxy-3-methylbut-2-enyl diphosphate reductase [Microbispora oryzae]MBP2704323.1 4-hydroxy-3-methylbut-2-enyl diphosphate reductase [Microbispora oryzae]
MGRVLLAAPRGYCAGVERAVRTVEEVLRREGPPIYVRKQIVHNTFVVDDLTRRGVIFVEELDEVPDGAVVVFSAHGVAPAVREHADRRALRAIDATCPLVTKVHKEAVRFAEAGYEIVLIGHAGHEEVEGTRGEAPERIQVVDPDGLDDLRLPDDRPVSWVSQTTLSAGDTMAAVSRLRERHPGLIDPPSEDICYASQNRQEAVAVIAPECELVLVVGSANSSNSRRLVEVAIAAGADAGHLVDHAGDLQERWLEGVETVGVSAGASVPEQLVTGLLERLAASGFTDVRPVTTAEETMTFSLPPELRSSAWLD